MANSIDFYRLPAPVLVAPTPVAGGSLVNGTTYYYRIMPVRGINTLPGIASSYDTLLGPVSNDVSFTASSTNKSCKLDWTIPDGYANGHHIWRSTTPGVFPESSHLATVGAITTFTDTGITTAAQATSYSDQQNMDIPLINVRGYYYEGTVPAGTPTVTGNTLYLPSGSFVVDSLKDRVLYWFTDRARFTDDSGRILRYAKIRSNTASSITFYTNPGTVLPIAGDLYKISWNMEDIYAQYLISAPANINALMSYDQAGQGVMVKNRYKNYTINACLAVNAKDVVADFGMLSLSRDNIEFGQLCRFRTLYNGAFYCGNCSSDYGSGEGATMVFNLGNNTGDTMQNGCDWFGPYDIGGLRWEAKAKYPTFYGNDSIQPQWSAQSTTPQACYRHCGSTFIGTRAISPQQGTIFLGNQFLQANGPEASSCETNGMNIVGALTNAIRPSSAIETRDYNTNIIGGANAMDMYAYDGDSSHLINPSPQTLAKCLGNTITDAVHWESSPNAGTLWIDYQLGFNIKDNVTGLPIQDAIVEVFDKDGNPLYADICNRKLTDKEHYIKGTLQSASLIRNFRSAWYPVVSVPEYRPALYVHGRYYGYQNTAYKITVGELDNYQQSVFARSGKALKFDTTGARQTQRVLSSIDQATPFEKTFYHYYSSNPSATCILARLLNTALATAFDVRLSSSGDLSLRKADTTISTVQTALPKNQWNEIKTTYNPVTMSITLTLNGVLLDTLTNSSSVLWAKLALGHITACTFTSYLDDLTVKNNGVTILNENFDGNINSWSPTAGAWGSYVSPQLNIPSTLHTGYVQCSENEVSAQIDKNKVYLFHFFGDVKYAGYIGIRTTGGVDGLGLKSSGVDESLTTLPTGYGSTNYVNQMRIEGRQFLTDVNGRIPLLDFKAISIQKGPTHTYNANIINYKIPWTIKISKVGYVTQKFAFSPSGLYEKEFNISLVPGNGFPPVILCDNAPAVHMEGGKYTKF